MEPARASIELAAAVERSAGFQPWRRVFHAVCGLAIVGLVVWLEIPRLQALTILAAILAIQLAADAVRLALPRANILFFRAFSPLVTPRESNRIASSTWYVLGTLLAIALLPREAAIGGILVLALADPAANLVGRRWGRRRLGMDGTFEGTAAFFLAAFLTCLTVTAPFAAAVAALGTTVIERLPIPLDDNLTIPLAAGAALWGMGVA